MSVCQKERRALVEGGVCFADASHSSTEPSSSWDADRARGCVYSQPELRTYCEAYLGISASQSRRVGGVQRPIEAFGATSENAPTAVREGLG